MTIHFQLLYNPGKSISYPSTDREPSLLADPIRKTLEGNRCSRPVPSVFTWSRPKSCAAPYPMHEHPGPANQGLTKTNLPKNSWIGAKYQIFNLSTINLGESSSFILQKCKFMAISPPLRKKLGRMSRFSHRWVGEIRFYEFSEVNHASYLVKGNYI